MTKVSKYPLDKDIETEMFRKFWLSMSGLRDADAIASFFTDFLSGTESLMLAKRFTIAVLLLRGKRPKDITGILHVSYSATGSVSSWLKNASPKTLATLERVIKESKWESLLDKIEALLDTLPPQYGTDWSKAGKEKWKRTMERATRQTLR
ncbi:hypothetical protein A3A64_03615 [Candidatus Gottesmanbacteria bacterium RIFCSPLOWO2_01_FULL_48_11]|uniref:Uncharacterized protein n=1 Tax=Candidatus Gottesmanbacteria bacterium RIFCSPLOWO2_01_FULL_48_11 TaxID=1798395 RepID=A0A1F6AUN1_9BACT|nr:MAG: hypothetical protein A3A64_03615 [Candidatus Gottesmanbacteria bacterium RIFCSPLOWO2_01_FULL_48_11]